MPKTTYKMLRTFLIESRKNGLKWREVGKSFPDVPLGTLCRIVKDAEYEPKSPQLRAKLGLCNAPIAVEPCPRCGAVHVTKHCPKSAPKYAPHPVMRLTELERRMTRVLGLLNSETPSSIHQTEDQS